MADRSPRTSLQPGEESPPEGQEKRPSQEGRKSIGGNEQRKSISGPGEPGAPPDAAPGNEQRKSISGAPGATENRKSGSAPGDPAAAGQEHRKSGSAPVDPAAAGQEQRKSVATDPMPPPPPEKALKPRKSMLEQLLAQIPGNRPAAGIVADRGARELSGRVQNFFAIDDRLKEAEALKPLRRPKLVWDNTYRLSAHNPFSRDRVEKILRYTMAEMMQGVKYTAEIGGDTAKKIAERVRARIMTLRFDRYKIVVLVNVGPINRQGLHIGFRFLWDNEKDHYVHATHKTTHCFCTSVVYGVYFE